MSIRTLIIIFVAYVGMMCNPAISADITTVTNNANHFSSEGTCSCKPSWDCFARIGECSEEEAYKNAAQLCLQTSGGVMQIGSFEHEDCSTSLKVCDIARAKFYCAW